MYKGKSIAVVIPAHNEEEFIGQAIETIPDFVDHIIVVDDASTDRTHEIAASRRADKLQLFRSEINLGLGGAVITGYRKALQLNCDIIVKMDGDGQMSPEHLHQLLDAIIELDCDYAKGNRFLLTRSIEAMPKLRIFGNFALTFLTKLASGYWQIFDPQNGYTAIKRSALENLDLDSLDKGFFFENDVLVRLNILGSRVKDVAIPAKYGGEESDLRIVKILLTFPWLLFVRFWVRIYKKYILYDFSPIALFLIVGLLLMAWGLGFGIYLWIKSIQTQIATPTGTIMLSLLPLILGFQIFLQAIVLDIQESKR